MKTEVKLLIYNSQCREYYNLKFDIKVKTFISAFKFYENDLNKFALLL